MSPVSTPAFSIVDGEISIDAEQQIPNIEHPSLLDCVRTVPWLSELQVHSWR